MPKGTAIGTVYPTYSGKNAGTNLHRINPSAGDSVGNGMHKAPRKGTKSGSPKRNRGSKPPSKAVPSQPHMGKSGGSLGGQTMGKIV